MKRIINKLKYLLFNYTAYFHFYRGWKTFKKTGQTPEKANKAMIRLYCRTNGAFNEKIQKIISKENPPLLPIKNTSIVSQLEEEGYAMLQPLPHDLTTKLFEFGKQKDSFTNEELLANPLIEELSHSEYFMDIARGYFKSEPIFDRAYMWWLHPTKKPDSQKAQFYHFDLDRIKWLEFFIYLNDVTELNAPHHYIKGTHKVGIKDPKLLKRGYTRIPDEDLDLTDLKVITGKAGTVFVGDTKCWHKGGLVKKGKRLILEFQFTSSKFGANY